MLRLCITVKANLQLDWVLLKLSGGALTKPFKSDGFNFDWKVQTVVVSLGKTLCIYDAVFMMCIYGYSLPWNI